MATELRSQSGTVPFFIAWRCIPRLSGVALQVYLLLKKTKLAPVERTVKKDRVKFEPRN